jgi:hypothetical protein
MLAAQIKNSNAQIQQLTIQVSELTAEKFKAIELCNRVVEIVEKPKNNNRSKNKGTTNLQEEKGEKELVEKEKIAEEEVEHEEEAENKHPEDYESSIPKKPKKQSLFNSDQGPPEVSLPYPPKGEKKEKVQKQNMMFEGYLSKWGLTSP